MSVQHGHPRFGTSAMVVGNRRLYVDGQQFPLTKLNPVAAEDRRKQRINVPIQPFPHGLARRLVGTLESAEHLSQMLNNGRRLQVHVHAVEQNRNLTPAERAKNSAVLCIPFWKLT